MSEHDDNPSPAPAVDPVEPVEVAPAAVAAAPPPPPTAPRTAWRDRVFRMRSVAAVAVAGVIVGAAGGAVTTALVSDHDGDHPLRPGIGQQFGPGQMPMVPPGSRQVFPGMPQGDPDGDDDQGFPLPPGSDSGSGSDSGDGSGTGQDSSYSVS